MDIMPIRCEADYDATLDTIDSPMDAAPDTPEADRLQGSGDACRGLRGPSLAAGSARLGLNDRACHGSPRLSAEGPRPRDRVAAARLGSAAPPPPLDLADDPGSLGAMEAPGRHARTRVRSGALDAN